MLSYNHSVLLTKTAPAPAPNYSCLLPPSFTSLTDVEDFLTQFEAVSSLSNWVALTPDPRPHFFSARFTGDALIFYRSLTTAQKGDYRELKRLFRQQYKHNADVSKAQVKSLRQLPRQDLSAFYRTLRDFAGKAYSDDALRNELLLTTFIEGLAKSVVQSEVRKAKPTVVEDALSKALEMQSCLNLHGQQPGTPAAPVNSLTGPSPSQRELFSDLIFTIKGEVKRDVDERSAPPQRGRSGERPPSSRPQQSESNNHTNQNQRRTWNQNQRNRTNTRGNTPNRGQSHDSKNRVSSTILAPTLQKNANVLFVKIMRPKIVKPASNVGAWDIFGVTAAVSFNL